MNEFEQLMDKLGYQSKAHEGVNLHHSQFGLFTLCGLENPIFSTLTTGTSLASRIPMERTVVENPLVGYLAGYEAPAEVVDPDNDPAVTGDCFIAPPVGSLLTCTELYEFGYNAWRTQEVNIRTINQRLNAGETMPVRVANQPVVDWLTNNMFSNWPTMRANMFSNEIAIRWQMMAMAHQTSIAKALYTGTGLTRKQFKGLQQIVNTGHVDVKSGDACPSVDSLVVDFGDVDIATVAGAEDLVQKITDIYYYLVDTARRMNFGEVDWKLVMPRQMFHEITARWPTQAAAWQTYTSNASLSVNVNSSDMLELSDRMRRGSYLLIEGQRVEVILDDFSPTTYGDSQKEQSGDIYFLPFTVQGGTQQVLYWEVYNWQGTMDQLHAADPREMRNWSDGGTFYWSRIPETMPGCLSWQTEIRLRLILRTPQLAARLQNVKFNREIPSRSSDPYDPYYVSGGTGARGV